MTAAAVLVKVGSKEMGTSADGILVGGQGYRAEYAAETVGDGTAPVRKASKVP